MEENNYTTLNKIVNWSQDSPNKLAIFTSAGSVTYKQLAEYAWQASNVLKAHGVKKGDFVSIELPRVWQYIGFCLACWMCRAAFIASDAAYPQARRDYIATDCDAVFRIDEDNLQSLEKEIESFRANNNSNSKNYADNCNNAPSLSDDAFAIYTSGSTGKPKGIVHSHKSLLVSVERHINLANLQTDDNWASPAAFSFITGIVSVLGCISGGATCFVVPDNARQDLNKLADFCAGNDITIMFLPPAIIPYFKQKKHTLRTLFTGSERATNVFSQDYEIINCWGPTEMCNIILAFKVDKPYVNTPIGKPIGEEKAYILDANDNEVEEGELCIAGHMAKSYIGMPEASAKVFRPNPFKSKDGFETIIHSGDKVRRLPDGNIEFIERYDWMVNINGQRVEPGEVAAVITQLPQILKCEVIGFEKQDKTVALCAYFQPVAQITEGEIVQYLSQHLPSYMIPEKFVLSSNLPVLANGKINRSLLENPFDDNAPTDIPDDPTVAKILDILKRCSGRSDYSYEEDLTKAGISSLTAIRMLATIDDELGVTISVDEIYDGCSIKSVSELVKSRLK